MTGKVHVTGGTRSVNFPTANALDTSLGGLRDAFVTKLNPLQVGAASLIYSTYLGGSGDEGFAGGIAADTVGNSYVVGNTSSTNFPATPGAFRTTLAGSTDVFVAKLNPAGSAFVYATYLGGIANEIGGGIAVNASGNAYVTGFTNSTDFPTLDPLQAANSSSAAYKSVNGGNSWGAINTGLTSAQVNALALDPMAVLTLYTGTANGVFKSVNGGGNWSATSLTTSTSALAIAPTNTTTIYAGTTARVFKSVDAGTTWNATGLTVATNALAVDPLNAATVYAGTGSGVSKSVDGGTSWMATSLTATIGALAIDPATPATIYAGTSGSGVFKSTDSGASWNVINTGLFSSFIQAIAINPATPSTIYAGTSGAGVFKSTDGGNTWNQSNAGLPADIRALAIAQLAPATLYAGSGTGGVFNSTDSGATWNATNLTANSITSLVIAPNTTSTVYAGSSAGNDAFVAKLHTTGSSLIYATYLGGTALENGQSLAFGAIAVEGENAYVTGITRSNNFPTTPGAFQTTFNGLEEAFVVKIAENNTPAGVSVVVQPVNPLTQIAPVTLLFSNVTQPGNTSVVISNAGPTPPAGFQLGLPPTYYDLTTTASFSGTIQTCFDYTNLNYTDETNLRLFHYEGGTWVDVTTSLNTATNIICGNVTSLSPFAILQRTNQSPVVSCQNATVTAGANCTADASINNGSFDPDGDAITITQSPAGPYPLGTTPVTLTVTDSKGASSQCSSTVTVNNPAPTVTINSPASGAVFAVGTPVNFAGSFTDNPGMHTATWMFDALSQAGTVNEMTGAVSATYAFTTAGVYKVKLTVDDGCGGTGMATTVGGFDAMVVIYDPNGGFVTGGGWITSPPGAYTPNPALTGKANFGFVSKYKTGASTPTGQTEFQFKAGNFNFQSTSYDWLVVAGARAQYKGTGTINDAGSYSFLLTAIDGQINGGGGTDKFRIKIWNAGGVIYDNQSGAGDNDNPTTALGGGSIVIHK